MQNMFWRLQESRHILSQYGATQLDFGRLNPYCIESHVTVMYS